MSTKELIETEIGRMDESQLAELYQAVRKIAETKTQGSSPSLTSKLKQVKVQAPEDFELNLRNDPFIGLWQERENFADSTNWVRALRENEWAR